MSINNLYNTNMNTNEIFKLKEKNKNLRYKDEQTTFQRIESNKIKEIILIQI